MIKKIFGAVSLVLGFLIIVGFPSIREYQPEAMSRAGVLIGIILIGIGLYLLKT
jgi:hypothetical protein